MITDRAENMYQFLLKAAEPLEREFRHRAWNAYLNQGLPQRKTESWKYSNLNQLTQKNWLVPDRLSPDKALITPWFERWREQFYMVTLSNGVFLRDLSEIPEEIKIETANWNFPLQYEDGFTAMTAATSRQGLSFRVVGGARLKKPLLILNVQEGEDVWAANFHRIVIEEGAKLSMVEIHLGGNSAYLRTEVFSVQQEAGSELEHLRVQMDDTLASHFSNVQIYLKAEAKLKMTQMNMGASWSRANIHTHVGSPGTELEFAL